MGIRRVDFQALTGLSRTAFDSRVRRAAFHFVNAEMAGVAGGGRRQYSLKDALYTCIADGLVACFTEDRRSLGRYLP